MEATGTGQHKSQESKLQTSSMFGSEETESNWKRTFCISFSVLNCKLLGVDMCVYVIMYVYVCVCDYVCKYVCMYVCGCVCIYAISMAHHVFLSGCLSC